MDENAVNTQEVGAQAEYSEPTTDYESLDSSSEETGSGSSEESTIVASAETEDGGMSLVKDPVTGKVSLKFGDAEQNDSNDGNEDNYSESEPSDASERGSDSVDVGQNNVRDLPMYNLEEFSDALANGYVDPNRVPQEYQAQYADYKIREALQQRQAQQEAARQQEMEQRRRIAEQMSPENRAQTNKDFYKALDAEATAAALAELGITQKDLDDAEFEIDGDETKRMFEEAKVLNKQKIIGELEAKHRQEQTYKAQQQKIYEGIQGFIAQQRATEPNFNAIDKMLGTRYQTMPLNQGKAIEDALNALQNGTIDNNGLQILDQYYNFCRKEFYANKSGLKSSGKPQQTARKAPPVVESAGQGQQVAKTYKPNYKALRSASVDERSAWFKEYFKNNSW